MRKGVSYVIFWAAVWGLTESTIGHVLYIAGFGMGWLFWFPLAFYFMSKVYKQTATINAVLYSSIIAALIKLVDLFTPTQFNFVINPAVSILIEGLVIAATFKLLEQREVLKKFYYARMFFVSIVWRILYIAYLLFLPRYLIQISPIGSMTAFTKFILMESVVNASTIYLCFKLAKKMEKFRESDVDANNFPSLHIAIFQLAIAIFVQLLV